ncbi:hypothetical protein Cco03nite_12210 [Catellatospora coxensis]|uniref:Uncharacterized protein n=1 Tax=Catellatospora coxensis TaxID=310354 RepID=A0A8J3KWR9_9ACTN|nr:hypothetical protein Cco03nite_12210 [Catellatospora coxensis]
MLRHEGGYTATSQDALTRWPTQGRTNWVAVDPPRVWDMLRHEDDELGWEQVKGLRAMASLLMAQADKLTRQRDTLARMWPADQSQAAAMALRRLDILIASMRQDSEDAIQNALAIDGIMAATAKAKREVHKIVQAWELTTNDGGPEWWDREATRLSYLTEQTMDATERAIREHRSQIVSPAPQSIQTSAGLEAPPPPPPPTTSTTTRDSTVGPPRPRALIVPPPVPGRPPFIEPLPSDTGPDLQGYIPPAPALPGQPVSMLPISPGSPYAPYGGAYVLPGPGVGQNGYVVALPPAGSGAAATVYTPPRTSSAGMPGMMPIPMGGPGQTTQSGDGAYRRTANTRWEIAYGVSPVIQPGHSTETREPSAQETEETFRQWFTQSAMPWRLDSEPMAQAPIVTIRRGVPHS